MAATLRSRTFLSLPPHLRASTYQQVSARSFSASPSRKATTLLDLAVAGPSALLNGIHGLGIPWYATLPITAVIVRSTLVYYISTRPSRRSAAIQSHLTPLASAQVTLALNGPGEREQRNKALNNGVSPMVQELGSRIRRWRSWNQAMSRLGALFGARRWHPRGLFNFGVLIAFTEAIRLKCGSREGLLPTLLSPFEWLGQKLGRTLVVEDKERVKGMWESWGAPVEGTRHGSVAQDASVQQKAWDSWPGPLGAARQKNMAKDNSAELPSVPAVDPADTTTQAVLEMDPVDVTTQAPQLQGLDSLNGPATSSSYFDPSLQSEGLSWCMNLTVPDTTLILPFALSATMAATFLLRPTVNKASRPKQTPTLSSTDTSQNAEESPEAATILNKPRPGLGAFQRYMADLTFMQRIGLSIALLFWFAALKMPAAILLYFIPSIATGWLQNRYLDAKMPIPPPVTACKRPIRVKHGKEWVHN